MKLIKCRSSTTYRDLQKPNPVTSEGKLPDVTAEDVLDFTRKPRCDRLIAESFTLSKKACGMLHSAEQRVDFASAGYILKPSPLDGMEIILKILSRVKCNQRVD